MTYQEAVSYIHARKRFNGPPTLDRMRRLMALLGDPQERLRIVHIAGAKGPPGRRFAAVNTGS